MVSTGRKTLKEKPGDQRARQREKVQDELRSRSGRMRQILTEFQPDAVEIEQRSVPGGARWTLYLVTLLLVTVVWWSWWAQVDEIVMSPGKIVSSEPILIIQGAAQAPVKSMTVEFGQVVRPGDTLATLDPTLLSADVRQIEVKIATIRSTVARLNAERAETDFDITGHESDRGWMVQLAFFEERKKQFNSKMEEFDSEILKIESQKTSNELELAASRDLNETLVVIRDKTQRLYEKGNESEVKLLNSIEQVKQQETKILVADNKFRELDAQLNVINKQRTAFVAGWRAEIAGKLTEAYDQLDSLNEDLNKAQRNQEFTTIPVPVDGKFDEYFVLEVAERTIGSVIQQGEALVKLAPLGAPLVVEMDIPSRDIGKVKLGDTVNIKLAAYSYQKHGFLTGKISTISEGTEDQKQGQGEQPRVPYYKARVTIDADSKLSNVSEDFRLIPDMMAECEIKVGRRRVIEFFLYPIWRAFDSSIREP